MSEQQEGRPTSQMTADAHGGWRPGEGTVQIPAGRVNWSSAARARLCRHFISARSAVYVFAGGVIGTAVRMLVSTLQPSDALWPAATISVNLIGAFLLGCLLEFFALTGEDVGLRKRLRLFAGTGIMGGFTTYGTFILETDTRLEVPAHFLLAVVYVFTSVICGLIAAGIGINVMRVGRRFHLLRLLRRLLAGRQAGPVAPAPALGELIWSADEFPEPDLSQEDPDAENEDLHIPEPPEEALLESMLAAEGHSAAEGSLVSEGGPADSDQPTGQPSGDSAIGNSAIDDQGAR